MSNTINFTGRLTADPKIFGQGKKTRAVFTVASSYGKGDDEITTFVPCTAFGSLADNIAESLSKGMQVTGSGYLRNYTKEVVIDDEDVNLTMLAVTVHTIGPALNFASADVTRNPRNDHFDEDLGEEEEEVKPARKRKPRAKAKPAPTVDDDDFEEEEEVKPVRKRKPRAKAKPAPTVDDDDFEDDDDEF